MRIDTVVFFRIYFDGSHVVIPDIVVLKTQDYESGNEHHIEVVTQGARDEVQQIKEHSEPELSGCFARFQIVIDSSADND